jgi:heavy metal sensor kinase
MRLSIRWRLTLWNTLALAVVLLGFGGLVYGLLSHFYEHTDRALRDRAERALRRTDQVLRSGLRTLEQDRRLATERDQRLRYLIAEFWEHEKMACVVYRRDGRVVARTAELAADSAPPAPLPPPAAEPRFTEGTVPVIGRQRILVGLVHRGGSDLTVLVMASLGDVDRAREEVSQELADVDREYGQLLLVLATSVPGALLLIGGLGYFLARKALAPVDQIRRLTEAISADRLDRRLPVANPNDELGRMAQTINAMIGRLERSFAEIRRFTADASHELRTPLTAIRTEAEVALAKPCSPAEYQHLLGSILEECERLTRLADQLLTLCREDAGKSPPVREPVDLAALVDGVVETMRPLAQVRAIEVRAAGNGPLPVQGDAARLRQVFYNLLDNAIKYTPEGGRIDVQLDRDDGHVVARVRDTGIGIAPEHLPHVFDRFYRVDKARSRAEGGTGLGLSIVQSIVAAHGGRVEMTSRPGQGTTCTVTLPEGPKP